MFLGLQTDPQSGDHTAAGVIDMTAEVAGVVAAVVPDTVRTGDMVERRAQPPIAIAAVTAIICRCRLPTAL